ncbi:MAG: two-component system, OmpR family, sensor histidine kinase MprB [Actinomycetota bacterium]|jgi:two-component system sensor histidine kinase MprB|nr:two-component system, OmpR family, sensor histidine kinase MprB [Actinomycetota bacterium]
MLSSIAVFVAITLAGGAAFAVAARVVTDEVDASLSAGTGQVPTGAAFDPAQICTALRGSSVSAPSSYFFELLQPDGSTCRVPGRGAVVTTEAERKAPFGAGQSDTSRVREGVTVDGQNLRVQVTPLPGGYAFVAARGLSSIQQLFRRLRGILFLLSIVGAFVALGLGLAVARAGLRPLGRLTGAVEEVARTRHLDVQIEVPQGRRRDEVARLADAFNSMVSALAQARTRQAQLVADAGHELRTPLTSLRTNIDLLVRSECTGRALPADQREALLTSVTAQLEEMSELVGELVFLAHEDGGVEHSPLRLDAILDVAVERARRRAGGRTLAVENEPWELVGDAGALERAMVNLLDNAVKFSPPDSTVTVRLAGGALTVTDQGPGVPAADRDKVFDRFWRGDDARGMPGSGLGMAIVADAAASHDGTVRLGEAPGGGVSVVFSLPGHRPAQTPIQAV